METIAHIFMAPIQVAHLAAEHPHSAIMLIMAVVLVGAAISCSRA